MIDCFEAHAVSAKVKGSSYGGDYLEADRVTCPRRMAVRVRAEGGKEREERPLISAS